MYIYVVVSYCNILFKRILSVCVNIINVHPKMLELMVTVKSILTELCTQLGMFLCSRVFEVHPGKIKKASYIVLEKKTGQTVPK